ncbi:unnamed protein product [Cochlearia groenlandica]
MYSKEFIISFSLLLCLPVVFFFFVAPHVFPSPPPGGESLIPISDEIDDQALFIAAAGSTSLSHLSSENPKLKIAFLFLTNSDLHFAPIWDRFFSNHPKSLYNVYVHADPFVNITKPKRGSVFENAFIANAKRTARASPTLISATRRLLAAAFLDDPANTYFAVLSQYCIPLHSFSYVYASLFESSTFDKSDPDPDPTPRGIRVWYRSFIELISDEPRLWKRYNARGRYAMMPEVPFEKFRVGSQFFVMTRRHALLTIKDRVLWRKFKIPCYRSDECYPEEHYFPTLLNMKDPDGCTGYTLTRVNWTGTVKGHPYTYKPKEIVPGLIKKLRRSSHSSSYLFARKFTPDCLKPLLAIADSVIFRD